MTARAGKASSLFLVDVLIAITPLFLSFARSFPLIGVLVILFAHIFLDLPARLQFVDLPIREWLGVRHGVLDGYVVHERVMVDTADAFNHMQSLTMRKSSTIDPSL